MDPITLGALAVWRHIPEKQARGRVLLIHGIGEHSARHENTYKFLTAIGFEVVRFDLRGAGRSGGRRQWVEKFEDYVTDAAQVLNWIQSTLPQLPLFVLGHSLGGEIAVHFAASYWKILSGLMVSAPAYKIGGAVSPLKLKVGQFLEHLTPTLRIPKGGDNSAISRDPRVVREYESDPLACHFNTVQQANEILRALEKMPQKASEIKCPVLIAHGTHDRIIELEGSFDILRSLGATDKTMILLPGVYHEPHNDYDKEYYFTCIQQWLEKHLPNHA